MAGNRILERNDIASLLDALCERPLGAGDEALSPQLRALCALAAEALGCQEPASERLAAAAADERDALTLQGLIARVAAAAGDGKAAQDWRDILVRAAGAADLRHEDASALAFIAGLEERLEPPRHLVAEFETAVTPQRPVPWRRRLAAVVAALALPQWQLTSALAVLLLVVVGVSFSSLHVPAPASPPPADPAGHEAGDNPRAGLPAAAPVSGNASPQASSEPSPPRVSRPTQTLVLRDPAAAVAPARTPETSTPATSTPDTSTSDMLPGPVPSLARSPLAAGPEPYKRAREYAPAPAAVTSVEARLTLAGDDPCGGPVTASFPSRCARPLTTAQLQALMPGDAFRECENCPEMVVVPAGSFAMGAAAGDNHSLPSEGPRHVVKIARPFAVGRLHVTRDQFAAFVSETGYRGAGTPCLEGGRRSASGSWRDPGFVQQGADPVVCVSPDDAGAYAHWLTDRTGSRYRLLSEAEFEYAARGRTTPGRYPRFWFGDDARDICRFANGDTRGCDDGFGHTAPAGHYPPNAFGLSDMAGNASQWVLDCWHASYAGAPADGSAWTTACTGAGLVTRGGSWSADQALLRAAARRPAAEPDDRVGMRLARDLDEATITADRALSHKLLRAAPAERGVVPGAPTAAPAAAAAPAVPGQAMPAR